VGLVGNRGDVFEASDADHVGDPEEQVGQDGPSGVDSALRRRDAADAEWSKSRDAASNAKWQPQCRVSWPKSGKLAFQLPMVAPVKHAGQADRDSAKCPRTLLRPMQSKPYVT
jgi:hypothetical protein